MGRSPHLVRRPDCRIGLLQKRFNPHLKCLIVPRDSADHVRSHLLAVAVLEDGGLEVAGPGQMLHVAAVALEVAFELRQRQIMGLQNKEPKVPPATGVQRA